MRETIFSLLSTLTTATLLLIVGPAAAQVEDVPLVAPSDHRTPEEQKALMELPPGFELQLVASEPDIQKPMNIRFDNRGRLWVTHSREYPFPAEEGETPRDGVTILDEIGPDGRARKITRYADEMNIPIGLIPLADGALVFSIPYIYRLETGEDGTAESRTELIGPFDNRDTHGMTNSFTRWIDGWIYATHGFANQTSFEDEAGNTITMHSGNTYRFRKDGSVVEHFTHGQVNPFGLTFDPFGNLFSADCHTKPVMNLLRGATYPHFGSTPPGIGFGPDMIDHLHGSTGIAGIAYYDDDHFPPDYRDNLYIGNPVTSRLHRDKLDQHGSTQLINTQPNLINSEDLWFRPVDIVMGPDGALYIADFYNKIIGHYEVDLQHPGRDRDSGRIWRIVYTGEDGNQEPPTPGLDLPDRSLDELIALLDDRNMTLRVLTSHEIVDRFGRDAVQPVQRAVAHENATPNTRTYGLWVLHRLGGLNDRLITHLADDDSPLVRTHLTRALAERDAWQSAHRQIAVQGLADENPFVRRAAAEALMLHPHPRQQQPLLDLWQQTPADDTHLIHMIRLALLAHIQQDGGFETARTLASRDADHFAKLADVAVGDPTPTAAAFVSRYLATEPEIEQQEQLERFLRHVVRRVDEDQLDRILNLARERAQAFDENLDVQMSLVRTVNEAASQRGRGLEGTHREWALAVAEQGLHHDHPPLVHRTLNFARDLRLHEVSDRALQLAQPDAPAVDLRGWALEAAFALDRDAAVPIAMNLLADADQRVSWRQLAARLLGDVDRADVRKHLVEQLRGAPASVAVNIASALAATEAGAELLLEQIETGLASATLLQESTVEQRLRATLPSVGSRIEELLADQPPVNERLNEIIEQRLAGYAEADTNPEQGQAVFMQLCAACHTIEGVGGNAVGPNLDGVGNRGIQRLLEDIIDPNRNVDQQFRMTIIQTTDGQAISGLGAGEEGDQLVVTDAAGQQHRIPVDDVASRMQMNLSLMPPNLHDAITEQQFYNLIDFLMQQRAD